MDIKGKVYLSYKVWEKDGNKRVSYECNLKSKGVDGKDVWVNVSATLTEDVKRYINPEFKKSKKTRLYVDVKKGFIAGFNSKENTGIMKFVITELELVEDTKKSDLE